MGSQVVVTLTRDEALVLFEALASGVTRQSVSPGTQVAFDRIEAQLERLLVEAFKPDYVELVAEAEHRLVNENE